MRVCLRLPAYSASAKVICFIRKLGGGGVRLFCQNQKVFFRLSLGEKFRFFHWELAFADIFASRGGFDIVLGNPPWLDIAWESGGVLSEFEPRFLIKGYDAAEISSELGLVFKNSPAAESAYFRELVEIKGVQVFLGAPVNYSELSSTSTNLYKAFLPVSWRVASDIGVIGLVHPDGVYEEAGSDKLRELAYPRLRYHFQFENQKKLFPIGNTRRFSLNVYGVYQKNILFDHISNLFLPRAIDECYGAAGVLEGIKNDDGEWSASGHPSRVIAIDDLSLDIFSRISNGDSGSAKSAKLLVVHSAEIMSVLKKISSQESFMYDFLDNMAASTLHAESAGQQKGIFYKKTEFPNDPSGLILSGPHIGFGNVFSQTPRRVCETHRAYQNVSLEVVGESYLPRTNYVPCSKGEGYFSTLPKVKWLCSDGRRFVSDFYRFSARKMLSHAGERSLIPALMPCGVSHIDAIYSIAFRDNDLLLDFLASALSLPLDFFVRSIGKTNLYSEVVALFPRIFSDCRLRARVLALNCVTSLFGEFWSGAWDNRFKDQSWAVRPDSDSLGVKALSDFAFSNLSPVWKEGSVLRRDYARRQALLEIDVLVSQLLGLSLGTV